MFPGTKMKVMSRSEDLAFENQRAAEHQQGGKGALTHQIQNIDNAVTDDHGQHQVLNTEARVLIAEAVNGVG